METQHPPAHLKTVAPQYPASTPVPGKLWVPVWSLQEPKSVTPESNKSFDQLVLDKMKDPTNKSAVKRRKVDLKAKVVTDTSYLKELQRLKRGRGQAEQKETTEEIVKSQITN